MQVKDVGNSVCVGLPSIAIEVDAEDIVSTLTADSRYTIDRINIDFVIWSVVVCWSLIAQVDDSFTCMSGFKI